MREACFAYLQMGGPAAAGPVGLLSGLNPSPGALVAHFFAVALFGVLRTLLPRPTCRGVADSVGLLWCALGIIAPIVRAEGLSAVLFPSRLKAKATRTF